MTFGGSTFSISDNGFGADLYSYNVPGSPYHWVVGLREANLSLDIGDKTSSDATYDLGSLTSIGPIAYMVVGDGDPVGGFYFHDVATTAGLFTLDDAGAQQDVYFTATIGNANANAVPEPGSLPLLAAAGAGMLMISKRRKPAKQVG